MIRKAVEKEKIQELKACIDKDFRLDLITDCKMKSEIAKLIALTDEIQLSNKAFRKELESWLRHNWSSGDGMLGYAFGISSIISLLGPFFIRTFDTSKSQVKNEELANKAPIIGILRTLLGRAEFSQLMFCIGYTKSAKHTPRRRLEEVIV